MPVTTWAQTSPATVQPLGSGDADALAADMRGLAANPQDARLLIDAGERALRLGDESGAAGLFARAEKVDPNNPRLKAGVGTILLHNERPGEALRYYDQAERGGADVAAFAADRGLAYDLVGDQPRAQREYRRALARNADTEVTKRYALSLGISGQHEAAVRLLDPLLRQKDRSAWRTQAFVLAMTGDAPGAQKIVDTMLPGQMAQGLQPFFVRLATLPAVDRAFAVNFGEVRPSATRLADARLAPQLPPLAPETSIPTTALAANTARASTQPMSRSEQRRRERESRVVVAAAAPAVALPKPVQLARATPARVVTPPSNPQPGFTSLPSVPAPTATQPRVLAQTTVVPQPRVLAQTNAGTRPANVVPSTASGVAGPVVARGLPVSGVAVTSSPVSVAQVARPLIRSAPASVGVALPTTAVTPASAASVQVSSMTTPAPLSVAAIGPSRPPATAALGVAPAQAGSVLSPDTTIALPGPVEVAAASPTAGSTIATPPPTAANNTTAAPPHETAASANATVAAHGAPTVFTLKPAPKQISSKPVPVQIADAKPKPLKPPRASRRESQDMILARIIAGISSPGSEIDAGSTASPRMSGTKPVELASVDRPARGRKAATDTEETSAPKSRSSKATAAEESVAKTKSPKARGKDKRDADDEDAPTPTKKTSLSKKSGGKADAPVGAKSQAPRIFVQVAGGAHEGDLGKAWDATKKKAPELFRGKQGYTTPLRATNRVLAGPFKTEDEAQSFINKLSAKGMSGFLFTSDKGQKVDKLPAKGGTGDK